MKTILAITDNSPASEHAAKFALLLAQSLHANLLLANTCSIAVEAGEKVFAAASLKTPLSKESNYMLDKLEALNNGHAGFKPKINEINIADKDENELIQLINHDHIWMVVKGMPAVQLTGSKGLNLNCILNRIQCPLMLVPESWTLKNLERIAYMADLRYCRIMIVKYLEILAVASGADLSIAHLSAKGLPHMAEDYALSVFSEVVSGNARYDRVFFNNIRERDLKTAVDVIINGLHADLIALVNHRFHFEEMMGRYITNQLPLYITVPLLIFPY